MPWFGRGDKSPDAPASEPGARHCPNAGHCPLFARFQSSPALRVWKKFFCESSFERCARLAGMQCGANVAPTLLPDGTHLEEER